LVNSLLTAIVRADGDALVLHVGEPPYVVSATGPIQLSSRPITVDAVAGMLAQLLPAESRRVLDELGAVEYDLPPSAFADGERFTAVVAGGGDDVWIEIRRNRPGPMDEPGPASEPHADERATARSRARAGEPALLDCTAAAPGFRNLPHLNRPRPRLSLHRATVIVLPASSPIRGEAPAWRPRRRRWPARADCSGWPPHAAQPRSILERACGRRCAWTA
jgi:hypothetical protein